MRILFFATYPTQATGYARIGSVLTNYLAEHHEVFYFGISNFKGQEIQRFIHPKITMLDALEKSKEINSSELYGVDTICDTIQEIEPNLVILYNDVIVLSRIFNKMVETNLKNKVKTKFKTISYLDLVYDFEKISLLEHVNNHSELICVFTDHWKKNLIQCGIPENKIYILPHGFDKNIFKPLDTIECKKSFGLKPDDFLILNTNRNSYRKAIDITVEAFVIFLKKNNMNPRIKLFMNMLFQLHIGYDILNLVRVACINHSVDYETVVMKHILKPAQDVGISDEMMNKLYNASDIGMNTCIGEGFGLCNLEHAALAKPQVITKTGGLQDIFNSETALFIKPIAKVYVCDTIDSHGGYTYITSPEEVAQGLETIYKNPELAEVMGQKAQKKILAEFDWEKILSNMLDAINAFSKN